MTVGFLSYIYLYILLTMMIKEAFLIPETITVTDLLWVRALDHSL